MLAGRASVGKNENRMFICAPTPNGSRRFSRAPAQIVQPKPQSFAALGTDDMTRDPRLEEQTESRRLSRSPSSLWTATIQRGRSRHTAKMLNPLSRVVRPVRLWRSGTVRLILMSTTCRYRDDCAMSIPWVSSVWRPRKRASRAGGDHGRIVGVPHGSHYVGAERPASSGSAWRDPRSAIVEHGLRRGALHVSAAGDGDTRRVSPLKKASCTRTQSCRSATLLRVVHSSDPDVEITSGE
jgi:hypothetical protein